MFRNTDASYSTCIPLVVSGGQDLKQHSKIPSPSAREVEQSAGGDCAGSWGEGSKAFANWVLKEGCFS